MFSNFSSVLCGDILPNPGSMLVSSHNFTSLSDVYEPFSSLTLHKLNIATLNTRSVCNKSAVICDHILHNKIDSICLTDGGLMMASCLIHLPANFPRHIKRIIMYAKLMFYV